MKLLLILLFYYLYILFIYIILLFIYYILYDIYIIIKYINYILILKRNHCEARRKAISWETTLSYNAPVHKAKAVMNYLKENSVTLLEWPPQSRERIRGLY